MQIYVGADHRGFAVKKAIVESLIKKGHSVVDVGDKEFNPDDDFPLFAKKVTTSVLAASDNNARGILVCGSGQGMVMAANRVKGIRAGLGWSRKAVQGVRNDEDANVLALPAELYESDKKLGDTLIDDFISTPFANAPRFIRRNNELDNI